MFCTCGRKVIFDVAEYLWEHLVPTDHEVSFGPVAADPDIPLGLGSQDFVEVVENPGYGQTSHAERMEDIYSTWVRDIPWWYITKHERGEFCHCSQCAPSCLVCSTFPDVEPIKSRS